MVSYKNEDEHEHEGMAERYTDKKENIFFAFLVAQQVRDAG